MIEEKPKPEPKITYLNQIESFEHEKPTYSYQQALMNLKKLDIQFKNQKKNNLYNYCMIPFVFTVLASIFKTIHYIFLGIFKLIILIFKGFLWLFTNVDRLFDLKKAQLFEYTMAHMVKK